MAWLKAVEALLKLMGRALSVLRRIPILDNWASSLQRTWLNPVVTHLIRDTDDPDLDGALNLHRKRLPEDQRCADEDIVRWIREDSDRRRRDANPILTDWFIVAKFKHRVCGFVIFHYGSAASLMLVAYMVVENTPGVPVNAVSAALASQVRTLLRNRRELQGCKGLIVEVEDPRKEAGTCKQNESLARIRRFCTLAETQGFTLRALDFDYRQPKLSLEAQTPETPLLLLSARVRPAESGVAGSAREETMQALSFVYQNVYPDGYSNVDDEQMAYGIYCENLMSTTLSSLPEPLRVLSCAQLAARIRNNRSRVCNNTSVTEGS
jgi:hypothetical protein